MRQGPFFMGMIALVAGFACKQQGAKSEVKFDAEIGKSLPANQIDRVAYLTEAECLAFGLGEDQARQAA